MADTVDIIRLYIDKRRLVERYTNVSDGTGESAVIKVDKSTLVGPTAEGDEPLRIVIRSLRWAVQGFTSVRLLWDHTTDDEAAVLSGNGFEDYSPFGGLVDPKSAGGTGDLLLTTAGTTSGNTYDITAEYELRA